MEWNQDMRTHNLKAELIIPIAAWISIMRFVFISEFRFNAPKHSLNSRNQTAIEIGCNGIQQPATIYYYNSNFILNNEERN